MANDLRATVDAIVDLSPDPLWVLDGAGTMVASNSAYQRWWGEIGGHAPELADLQRRALSGRSIMANVRLIANGVERMYSVHARPVASGGVAFAAREVMAGAEEGARATELALMHLFASNEPFRNLLTTTLEFLCATDRWDAGVLWCVDGDVLRPEAVWFEDEASRERLAGRFGSLTFRRGEGTPGRVWSTGDVVWIADMLEESTIGRVELAAASGLHTIVAAPLMDGERFTGVLELFTQSIRPINDVARRALEHSGGALARLIERRRLIDLLERKSQEWMQTFDSIGMPILLTTADAHITRLNRAAHELTGREYDHIVGQPIVSIADGEPWKTLRDIVTAVDESRMTCEAQVVANEATWDVSASPLEGSDGVHGVVITMRDTTEVVRLQESVRRGEQLAALGELVAGVAHEVKNPLFGMSLTLDLLDQQELAQRPEAAELTDALRKWIARLQSLTDNLLAFGRTWSTDLQPGDVHEVLVHAIASTRARAEDSRVTIAADLDAAHQTVLMDASRLVLVFENMLVNAIQHSSIGGTVRIAAERVEGGVEIAVRDAGPGFHPVDLPRIFQPFYTRRRGGTGLGLSIVQRIVDEHGGTVTASNAAEPHGGAVIVVRLPAYH